MYNVQDYYATASDYPCGIFKAFLLITLFSLLYVKGYRFTPMREKIALPLRGESCPQ